MSTDLFFIKFGMYLEYYLSCAGYNIFYLEKWKGSKITFILNMLFFFQGQILVHFEKVQKTTAIFVIRACTSLHPSVQMKHLSF
jgi:hypothetical protein